MNSPHVVVIATTNKGKARELAALLPEGTAVATLSELGIDPPGETGDTFAENARIKATAISLLVDHLVIADDSGLEVDALGGAPGVRSARYAGEPGNDERNIELLLLSLEGTSGPFHSARFICSIAVALRGELVLSAEGQCEGRVGAERRGENGFGYDSIFYLSDGRSMAELDPEEKNRLSHRARAYRTLSEPLLGLIDGLYLGEHQR